MAMVGHCTWMQAVQLDVDIEVEGNCDEPFQLVEGTDCLSLPRCVLDFRQIATRFE
jgi:hypothetical protein